MESIADLAKEIGATLILNNWTVSTMESCTGGGVAHELIKISGASNYVKGGMVTYTNEVKMQIGHVSPAIISEFTELSAECAMEMSKNARKIFQTDLGIGITGLLENGGSECFAYIAVSFLGKNNVIKEIFTEDRATNMRSCIFATLKVVKKQLISAENKKNV